MKEIYGEFFDFVNLYVITEHITVMTNTPKTLIIRFIKACAINA